MPKLKDDFTNSIDPDEVALNKLSHLDPHYLSSDF